MKKKAIGIFVGITLIVLLGLLIHRRIQEQQSVPRRGAQPVAVRVAPVRRETLHREGVFTGTLQPRSQVVVAPKVPGRLERLHVDMGDEVRSGDLLAELESEEYVQQVEQARAELDVVRSTLLEAQSALQVAENDLRRIRDLHTERIASDAQLDEVQARRQAAAARAQVVEAQIRQREAALKSAETRLGYTRLHAAWNGGAAVRRIGARFADEGTMLRANDPVVSVVDTELLQAVIFVIERDFPDVSPGLPVTLRTDAWPDDLFSGDVARVAPALDEQSRHARVEIEVPNPEGKLAPGMFVRAGIRFAEHPNVQVVPRSALVRRNGRQGVFLADLDAAVGRFVEVSSGISSADDVEIQTPELEGLVITLGHHLLEDGATITLPGGTHGPGGERGRPGVLPGEDAN